MIKNRIPSIWTGMYAELPLHQALVILADQGWRSVEVGTEHLCELEASSSTPQLMDMALDACVKHNLITLQCHASLVANVAHSSRRRRDEAVEQLKRQIKLAANLGIKNIIIHPGVYQEATTRNERKRMTQFNVKAFRELGNLAADFSMRIALENLPRRVYATSDELLELLDAIDHEAIGISFNTFNAQLTHGMDMPAAINDFGTRLICTQIADYDGHWDLARTPGMGKIEWADVMQALSGITYAGVVNLRISGERHQDLGMRALKSFHALQVADYLLELAESEE